MATDAGREATPLTDQFSLDTVINGLASDLDALRNGKISVDDARVRAELGKQILNGVRLVIKGQQFLAQRALPVGGHTDG